MLATWIGTRSALLTSVKKLLFSYEEDSRVISIDLLKTSRLIGNLIFYFDKSVICVLQDRTKIELKHLIK